MLSTGSAVPFGRGLILLHFFWIMLALFVQWGGYFFQMFQIGIEDVTFVMSQIARNPSEPWQGPRGQWHQGDPIGKLDVSMCNQKRHRFPGRICRIDIHIYIYL